MMAVMTVMSIMNIMTMMFMMALMNDVCGVRNYCDVYLMTAARDFQPLLVISWIPYELGSHALIILQILAQIFRVIL
jgi:hypothetical protein